MNQRVPSLDFHDVMSSMASGIPFRTHSDPSNSDQSPEELLLDYDVAELKWENGQIALHSLGPPRVPPQKNNALLGLDPGFGALHEPPLWDGPSGMSGTLEAIVDEAARLFPAQPESLVSHLDTQVPGHAMSFAHMASSSEAGLTMSGTSATFASISDFSDFFSENNSSGNVIAAAAGGQDSGSHGRLQRESGGEGEESKRKRSNSDIGNKSPNSVKRSRAAEIHNQSERKRRDKINERMKTLQKLVPNSSKTDKASMLDEVIEYLKQLHAQLHMMNRMNVSMNSSTQPHQHQPQQQQQFQMPMVNQMGMGMGMGMGMDMAGMGQVMQPNAYMQPNPYVQMAPWDGPGFVDPLAVFLATQAPLHMTPEAYCRIVAMYQQLHQPLGHKC